MRHGQGSSLLRVYIAAAPVHTEREDTPVSESTPVPIISLATHASSLLLMRSCEFPPKSTLIVST